MKETEQQLVWRLLKRKPFEEVYDEIEAFKKTPQYNHKNGRKRYTLFIANKIKEMGWTEEEYCWAVGLHIMSQMDQVLATITSNNSKK